MSDELANKIQEVTKACVIHDLPVITDWCSTGCTALDLAISNIYPGGMPIGRIIQSYGGASTAKTVLATTVLGYAIRSGKQAFLADVEHTFDPQFASYYGLDVNDPNFFYGYQWSDKKHDSDQPVDLEDFFDTYLEGILKLRSRKPKIVVVDTLTVLPARIELDKAMDKQGFGAYRAKQISLGLRRVIGKLAKKGVTLYCIDQTRDAVGSFFGGECTTGGRGLEFYSSVRLYLQHGKKVENSAGKDIGVWVKFKVAKNKVAPPFREGKFKILFDYGLDDVTSNLSFLAECQHNDTDSYKMTTTVEMAVCKVCGKLQLCSSSTICSVDGCEGVLETVNKRIMDWVAYIEEGNHELDLREAVAQQWVEAYKTEPRKTRVW